MPGTAVDNLNRWMVQQEEFTDEEALDYMVRTREEGGRHMPRIVNTNATTFDPFEYAVDHIGDLNDLQNGTATTTATNTIDINNTVFWTAPPEVNIGDVIRSERGDTEIIIRDEILRERVEQLGVQVKLLSDMVGEMKEFITLMGFDKLLGGSDGKKTER